MIQPTVSMLLMDTVKSDYRPMEADNGVELSPAGSLVYALSDITAMDSNKDSSITTTALAVQAMTLAIENSE